MNLGDRIEKRLKELDLTQQDLSNRTNINKSIINRIILGSRPARDIEIVAISKALDVTTDYLLGNKVDKPYYELTVREKVDIGQEVDKLMDGLLTDAEINFYGEPMTEDGKKALRVAIKMAMELNKQEAKKTFTPKKYRNE